MSNTTTHIPTADEIRGRLDYIGAQAAEAEAKAALVACERTSWADVAAIKAENRQPKASEERKHRALEAQKLALTALLDDLAPQYKSGDGPALYADDRPRQLDGSGTADGVVFDVGPDFRPGQSLDDVKGMDIATPAVWAAKAAALLGGIERTTGRKAVVSGSLSLPAVIVDTVSDPQNARRLLDLIPKKGIGNNNYGYLQQTVRNTQAAPVADHGTKPTSVYTFREVEDRARVLAHLSEPVPARYLQDHADLVRLLRSEMSYGVLTATEAQVVTGDGTGENFTGIFETSGTTDVGFVVDLPTTLRTARTALADLEEEPTAWVFSPADAEALDLLRENGTTGDFLKLDRVLGDFPIVQSTALTPGFALLADWRQTRLYVREGMRLDMDAGGALFDKNEVKFRAEQRANLALLRPQAVAVIDVAGS